MPYGPVKKQLVTDEFGRPTAVLIDTWAWRRIEKMQTAETKLDIMKFAGLLELGEEPLVYQRRVRRE